MEEPPKGAFQLEGKGVRFLDITDGLSNTVLVGEKHVPLGTFGQAYLDSSTYNGDNPVSWSRGAGPMAGLAQSIREVSFKFGSYHMGVTQFAFCDGRVQVLSNVTPPATLGLLTDRCDGQVIPDY
jgi:prepilin-type processing-associated H-X9-DG protein